MLTHHEKMILITDEKYPLSAHYDPEWIFENCDGGHCFWLIESLSHILKLRPGMRVLDLGCGHAITSIFLAKEFGVTVYAVDIDQPDSNYLRIKDAGVEDRVIPIQADAHRLPFASGFFDVIIAINSYQFFGTADNFTTNHISRLLRPGGQLGLVLFGPDKEFNHQVPDSLKPSWWPDFYFFHSLDWWTWHILKTELFDLKHADDMDGDGVRITHLWSKIMNHDQESPTGNIMRWNRFVFIRNGLNAHDLRTIKHI